MAYQVVQKKRFKNKLIKLLDYLEKEWGFKVAERFLKKMGEHLEAISQHAFLGRPEASKNI